MTTMRIEVTRSAATDNRNSFMCKSDPSEKFRYPDGPISFLSPQKKAMDLYVDVNATNKIFKNLIFILK